MIRKRFSTCTLRSAWPLAGLLTLAATLSGCSFAATAVGWPTVVAAEAKAKACIAALAANDKPKLLAQGLSASQADQALADAAGRIAPGDAKLTLEDVVDERYFRKYTVARIKKSATDHDTIQVLFTFENRSDSDYAHITAVEFIETKE